MDIPDFVKPKTLQDILNNAAHTLADAMPYPDARLQAELLLAHALGISRAQMLARLNEIATPQVSVPLRMNVMRRAQHEPLAYILGYRTFFGLDLVVDDRVLIPRFETETLVQLAFERARKIASPVIVDVGTGSGAIALALAKNLSNARVVAIDQSHDALKVAQINAERFGLESQVQFLHGDLLEPFVGKYNILVSNLPYIPTTRFDQLPREVRNFEPRIALDGGPDGLDVMRRLLKQLESYANRNAVVLLEISEEQGKLAIETIHRAMPNAVVTVHQDLEGLDRVVEILKMKDEG